MSRDVAWVVSTFEGTRGEGLRLKAVSTIKFFLQGMLPYCYNNLNIIYISLQIGEGKARSSLLSEDRLAFAMHPMNVQWKKLLARTTVWLLAEISLNLIGLDDLADYGEFVFERHQIVQLG